MTRTPSIVIEDILRNEAQVLSLLLELTPDEHILVPRWMLRIWQGHIDTVLQLLHEQREGV